VTTRELLDAAVRRTVAEPHALWFERALQIAAHGSVAQLLQVYTEASRHLGRHVLVSAPVQPSAPAGAVTEIDGAPLDRWTAEDAGRLAFLLARHDASPRAESFVSDATSCYEQGDAREQQSWLRGLSLVPGAERFRAQAIDACRTNIVPLFESIACDNPYPARHFPERNFNQLVLKALFNNIALARIVGLPGRLNPELARMATDYAAERTAAGRSVPPDIFLATAAGAQRTS
jgi:hypothetical protein